MSVPRKQQLVAVLTSTSGIRIANPGSNIRLNLPNRSTTHACCCGTNLIPVFVGRRCPRWKYGLLELLEELPNCDSGGGRDRFCPDVNWRRDQMAMGSVMPLAREKAVVGLATARASVRVDMAAASIVDRKNGKDSSKMWRTMSFVSEAGLRQGEARLQSGK